MSKHLAIPVLGRYPRIMAALAMAVVLVAAPIGSGIARAEDGEAVLIGRFNQSCGGSPTCFRTVYSDSTTTLSAGIQFPRSVLVAVNDYDGSVSGHPAGFAITGDAYGSGTGVQGLSETGTGIYGLANGAAPAVVAENSSSGAALFAKGRNGDAIIATTIATNRSAVFGENTGGGGYGVVGRTNAELRPGVWGDNIGGGNGVYGLSNGTLASGVYGSNSSGGYGVAGRTGSSVRAATLGDNTGSGPGVAGESAAGTGVLGISHGSGAAGVSGDATASNGIGILARASGSGTALSVIGTAKFSRSGTLTIPAGAKSVTVSGVALGSASLILATLQAYRAGVAVAAVVPHVASGSFTIYLTKVVTSRTKVAWFVVN
ncbi:MAG: hypothetical protein ABIZ34_02695 [Candidatus Limnocylindrales bacterium]